MLRTISAALAACTMVLAPWEAAAQSTFRCVGKDGRKYYGQTIPNPCIGQTVEEINKQGILIRRIENQTAEEREAKKEADRKKREEADAKKEETRRNRALLATYTSEKDIEDARARSLADNEKSIKEIERRIGQIKKRQGELAQEMEFYKKKPAPQKLQNDIKAAQVDLDAQQKLLELKKKEIDSINERYDDDKKRFLLLTGKK
jgi:hypothetical protein